MTFKQLYTLMTEDNIEDLQVQGNWDDGKRHGYDKASIGIMKNPNTIQRIKKKWDRFKYPIDMYIVKGPKIHQFTEIGKVPYEFLRNELKLDIPTDSEHITLVFTNNKGNEKMPMTPWTLAHRFGHAIRRDANGINYHYKELTQTVMRLFKEVASTLYRREISTSINRYGYENNTNDNGLLRALSHALGTFKSARDKNLRDYGEFTNELIAQFIITDNIKLNRDLPNILPLRYAWGNPSGPYKNHTIDDEEIDDIMTRYEQDIYNYIDILIGSAIGDIFVM